jgi:hypothetical protein
MHGQTTTTNHPIWFWMVFRWHKPFMILLRGKIPLKTHQSGHVAGGNGSLESFYLKLQNSIGHTIIKCI